VDTTSNGLGSGQDPTRGLRTAIAELEREILPQAIGLTDAFGFTDYELDRYASPRLDYPIVSSRF